MRKVLNILKWLLFSIVTVVVGYIAIAVPFNLFSTLTTVQHHILFTVEMAVYFVCFMAALFFHERYSKSSRKRRRHMNDEYLINNSKCRDKLYNHLLIQEILSSYSEEGGQ